MTREAAPHGDLPEKYQRFVKAYLDNGCHGTNAAASVGYADSTAAQNASKLLRRDDVREFIREALEAEGCTPEFCKSKFLSQARADIVDFEPWLAGEKTLRQLKAAHVDTSLIKSATVSQLKDGRKVRRLELYDGQRATSHLAELIGAVTQRHHISGDLALDFGGMSNDELQRLAHAVGGEREPAGPHIPTADEALRVGLEEEPPDADVADLF